MRNRWVFWGAVCCGLAVAGGAFGAHVLSQSLGVHELKLWDTACLYLFYGGCGQTLAGLFGASREEHGTSRRWAGRAALCLAAGSVLFSGTVGAMALGAPLWLGAVTPVGGILLIVGCGLLAVAARADS